MRDLTGEMILNSKLVCSPAVSGSSGLLAVCCDDWGDHRDSTLEALSDGLYVSPAIETADYHASLNKNSWFYVFDYQSKYGDYTTVGGRAPRYDELFFHLSRSRSA